MARRRRHRGQALVEFALALPLFLMLVFGIIDVGRAVYMFNGVSQAARELARVASVHPGSPVGTSPEAIAAVRTQKSLIPWIGQPVFHCESLMGVTIPGDGSGGCAAPDVIRVEVHAPFTPSALLGFGTVDIESSSSNQVQ